MPSLQVITFLEILRIQNCTASDTGPSYNPLSSFSWMLVLDFELENPVYNHFICLGTFLAARFLVCKAGIVVYASQDVTWGHVVDI